MRQFRRRGLANVAEEVLLATTTCHLTRWWKVLRVASQSGQSAPSGRWRTGITPSSQIAHGSTPGGAHAHTKRQVLTQTLKPRPSALGKNLTSVSNDCATLRNCGKQLASGGGKVFL